MRRAASRLRYAGGEGRCLVTRNVADFLELVRSLINRQPIGQGDIRKTSSP
jgi:hypothetical protein